VKEFENHLPMTQRWVDGGMALAEMWGQQMSKDPSTQVGACVMSADKERTYLGFNGFPKGVADDGRLHDRSQKYPRVVHAEANAVRNAKGDCKGGFLFVTLAPCSGAGGGHNCAGHIINSGIQAVFFPEPEPDERARWGQSQEIALEMFHEAGVMVFQRAHHTRLWQKLEPTPCPSSIKASSGSLTSWATTLRSLKLHAFLTARRLKRSVRTLASSTT